EDESFQSRIDGGQAGIERHIERRGRIIPRCLGIGVLRREMYKRITIGESISPAAVIPVSQITCNKLRFVRTLELANLSKLLSGGRFKVHSDHARDLRQTHQMFKQLQPQITHRPANSNPLCRHRYSIQTMKSN